SVYLFFNGHFRVVILVSVVESEGLGDGFNAEGGEAVNEVPVLVAGDGAGDEEIPASFDVGEEGLPSRFAEGLGRGKDNEFGGAKFVDLIFGDDVTRLVQIVGEGAHGVLLRGDL